MDLRIERTKINITNAFIHLRASKPLEKITIKELSELAFINKATFYAHYKDIYDLSEKLQNEAIDKMIDDIAHPEYIISKPKEGLFELANSILMQGQLFDILFSGSQQLHLLKLLEIKLKSRISELLQQETRSLEFDLLFSVLIQGSFYAFLNHKENDFTQIIEILGNINECIIKNYKFENP